MAEIIRHRPSYVAKSDDNGMSCLAACPLPAIAQIAKRLCPFRCNMFRIAFAATFAMRKAL
jgi:hypothetical protein